jgi:hypothetical protein
MMVPRGFAANPFASSPPKHYDEKGDYVGSRKRKSQSSPATRPSRSPSPSRRVSKVTPRPGKASKPQPQLQQETVPTTTTTKVSAPTISVSAPRRRESARDVLAATAIPIRKKPRQRPQQRLPDGDNVADFSRILRDDLRAGTSSSLSSSVGNAQFDGLFGNIDELMEGTMIVGSDGLDASVLTSRSLSTESLSSFANPEDFSLADTASPPPGLSRSVSDRRFKQLATSEDCASEHPLSDEREDDDGDTTPDLSISPPRRRLLTKEKRPSSFKSSLTASLKAIKNAAQSVSNYGIPTAVQPDDYAGHMFFDFQPSLTDDRRPPMLSHPPSPALRRYLNPASSASHDSPAQLNFWIDHRSVHKDDTSESGMTDGSNSRVKPKIKKKYSKNDGSKNLPSLVPLATCIPSQIRTAHASSPPVWLAPDGTPSNKQTASAMWEGTEAGLKQCEPRENRDFLRIYVCEMQMRKARKLRDDIEGRAKMWLPPVERERRRSRPAMERLQSFTAETL